MQNSPLCHPPDASGIRDLAMVIGVDLLLARINVTGLYEILKEILRTSSAQ